MALFSWAFRRRRVLSVTQPAWDEFSLSSCDVNQFSAFCYTTRSGSFIIHHHSSFSIHHCSFGIHHLSFIIQKSMKNQWKIYQKSIKNHPKIDQKSIQNQPKSVLEPPGPSWRGPRALYRWAGDFCSHSRTKWPFWRKMVISFESESSSKSKVENWKSNLSQKLDGYWLARTGGRGAMGSNLGPKGVPRGSENRSRGLPERLKNGSENDPMQKSIFEGCP